MRNIELKARCHDLAHATHVCEKIGARAHGDIHQTDTYFNVPAGRLKVRENQPGRTELIYYLRADNRHSKESDYDIVPATPELRAMLARALGVRAVVTKTRGLWLWHNVRIHLDNVEKLGAFIEFEAVLGDGFDDADGHAKVARLRAEFDIADTDLVACSYRELLDPP
jgi:predicted adenylyl cyclase CyaB